MMGLPLPLRGPAQPEAPFKVVKLVFDACIQERRGNIDVELERFHLIERTQVKCILAGILLTSGV